MKAAFDRARHVLDYLERHQLEPSPRHYALILRYFENTAAPLGHQIRQLTDGGLRLTAESAASLSLRYIAGEAAPDSDARGRAVAGQSAELSAIASDTHQLTAALSRDVGAFAANPSDWPAAGSSFSARLSEAERDLADVRRELADLRGRIIAPLPTPAGSAGSTSDAPAAGKSGDTLADAGGFSMADVLTQTAARATMAQLAHYDRGFAIVLVRLDGFDQLRTRYGETVGGNIQSALAATMRESFPDQDLIRWDDNEFVVVMMDTSVAVVRDATREALDALAARRLLLRGSGEWIGTVTASAAIITARGESGEAIIGRARMLLDATKDRGGSRIES